jgi:RNA-directed DNA polymerase
MKTHSNLFEKAVSLESILRAWDGFKVGKRHKKDVQEFEYRLEDNLFLLHDELTAGIYRHAPYYAFSIQDPKPRSIHKATVCDRVVHHVIYQTLAPLFEPSFIYDSYSCRENKGTHRAVKRLRIFLDKVYKTEKRCFVLKCDVRKFFQSIDHGILLEILRRKIKDKKMMDLVALIVDSFPSPGQSRERERERE